MDNTNNKTAVDNQVVISNKSSPVGLAQKEQQPPINPEVKSQIEAILEASEKAPTIVPEVREAGVGRVSDNLTLTDEHKAVGIEPAKESTPVTTRPLGIVKLPMSEEDALQTIKTTSKSDSKHWRAVLIEKIYKWLHEAI